MSEVHRHNKTNIKNAFYLINIENKSDPQKVVV